MRILIQHAMCNSIKNHFTMKSNRKILWLGASLALTITWYSPSNSSPEPFIPTYSNQILYQDLRIYEGNWPLQNLGQFKDRKKMERKKKYHE